MTVLVWAGPAGAVPVSSWSGAGGIQQVMGTCSGTAEAPLQVTLTATVDGRTAGDPELRVGCYVELDLAGFNLFARNVVVEPGQQLTIAGTGGGTLTADARAAELRAGIRTTDASLVVSSGRVLAWGGSRGAGIGGDGGAHGANGILGESFPEDGDDAGTGGTLLIAGGTVEALGGSGGAGIGGGGGGNGGHMVGMPELFNGYTGDGGRGGEGGSITISSGSVNATGGTGAAGLGGGAGGHTPMAALVEPGVGGNGGSGGTISIAGGNVVAAGNGGGAGVGGAAGGFAGFFMGMPVGTGGDGGSGGSVTISDGHIDARGGTHTVEGQIQLGGAGVGGGTPGVGGVGPYASPGSGGDIEILGGEIEASGGVGGAGIGGASFSPGGSITIRRGHVTALGGGPEEFPPLDQPSFGGAGIGGGLGGSGGTIEIGGDGDAAVVAEATGGMGAAGIGGGAGLTYWPPDATNVARGGDLLVLSGTVTATGVFGGAGIGGGHLGHADTTIVRGGAVTAIGEAIESPWEPGVTEPGGAGIGGGYGANGPSLTIEEAAVVTAVSEGSAVGAGAEANPFGRTRIDGTLRVPSGRLVVPDWIADESEIVVGPTGRILGTEPDPTSGADVIGSGQIENHGAIALDASLIDGPAVLDHSYDLTFDTDGADTPTPADVRVMGPSFDAGYRTFPPDPEKAGFVFDGWFTESDELVDASTELPGESTDGVPVPVALTASWVTLSVEVDDVTITAGEPDVVTPAIVTSNGGPYSTDPSTWTITEHDDLTVELDPVTGEVTVGGTAAGTYELTVTVPSPLGDLTAPFTVTVLPSTTTTLELEASDTTVDQGESVTFSATGTDEFGNTTGDVTDEVTLTSDVDTDEIDGHEVTFPTASPHTITATHVDGATASVVVEVRPAPIASPDTPATPGPQPSPSQSGTRLPVTGAPTGLALSAGVVLVVAGASLRGRVRRAGR